MKTQKKISTWKLYEQRARIIRMYRDTVMQNKYGEKMIPAIYSCVLSALIDDLRRNSLQIDKLVKRVHIYTPEGAFVQLGIAACFGQELTEDEIPF